MPSRPNSPAELHAARAPAFMIGCVRSGTTLLRNLLRGHPGLMCPEETHYYRWGEPFGTKPFRMHVLSSEVLKRHRKLDGIAEEEFQRAFEAANGRRQLMESHMSLFARSRGLDGRQWFDKTPQNVYGLPLLLHDFPNARFIHIVRNPFNVVASLMEGRVIAAPNAVAAANYWNEAAAIVNTLRPLMAGRLHELRYEELTQDPARELRTIYDFLQIAGGQGDVKSVHAERNAHVTVLTPQDRDIVRSICDRWGRHYGYDLAARVPETTGTAG